MVLPDCSVCGFPRTGLKQTQTRGGPGGNVESSGLSRAISGCVSPGQRKYLTPLCVRRKATHELCDSVKIVAARLTGLSINARVGEKLIFVSIWTGMCPTYVGGQGKQAAFQWGCSACFSSTRTRITGVARSSAVRLDQWTYLQSTAVARQTQSSVAPPEWIAFFIRPLVSITCKHIYGFPSWMVG